MSESLIKNITGYQPKWRSLWDLILFQLCRTYMIQMTFVQDQIQKKGEKKKKKCSHACISFFLYRWTALHKSLFPCWPKEQSSYHRMLQPWRVISTASFYLAMTYRFGHNCSWCWTGIMCYGFCLQVPNEVRGIVLTPINPDWVIICIPKRDTADPTLCDKKKLSGQCLALNWRNFAKAWAKCVMCWCHLVTYLQGVCIAGQ